MNEFTLTEISDWRQVIETIRPELKPGAIIALSGPLGAGKTTFAQLLGKELGLEQITKSPTFALMRAYHLPRPFQGVTRLVHIDAYRLEKPEDARALDLAEELTQPGTLLVIEWPEQIEAALRELKAPIISLQIELRGEERLVQLALQ